jgi:F-type H+-transporting ATPase subunit b
MLNPHDPLFWTLVALVIFFAILAYYKVPALVGKQLDDRAHSIRKELDEARRLREEAQQLLADYQRKSREAEDEAKEIVTQARREAELLAADTRKSLAETLERRAKAAEEKIARAEAQALGEVRSAAVDAAISAAEKLLQAKIVGGDATALIESNIQDLKGRLN